MVFCCGGRWKLLGLSLLDGVKGVRDVSYSALKIFPFGGGECGGKRE